MKLRSAYSEYADCTSVAAQVPCGSGGEVSVGFSVVGKPDIVALEEIAETIAEGRASEAYGGIDSPVLSWSRLIPEG